MSDMAAALFSLWEQSIERGFAGRLEDFDIKLCEDDRTVSIWAFYKLDEPLMAHVELPEPIDPAVFDPTPFYREAANFAAAGASFH